MKKLAILLVLMAALLVAGQARAVDLPKLEGTWSGPAAGIRPDGTVENLTLTMTVAGQVGQLFAGSMMVDRLDAEGKAIDQESLLFTGHISTVNEISMTLIPTPGLANPQVPAAAAVMHGILSETGINAVWENLTFGNTGWATLRKQVP